MWSGGTAEVHYLALTSEDRDLAERMRRRPAWRNCNDEAYIEEQVRFNRWLKEAGSQTEPAIELLTTTGVGIEETVEWVTSWIGERVGNRRLPGASG